VVDIEGEGDTVTGTNVCPFIILAIPFGLFSSSFDLGKYVKTEGDGKIETDASSI
jgi:hypothetical protein